MCDKISLLLQSKKIDELHTYLDEIDELKHFQSLFLYPPTADKGDNESKTSSNKCIYLCGNSLGLQPVTIRSKVLEQLDKWAIQGVEGHFTEPTPWLTIDDIVNESMSSIVGAVPKEVVMMNSLTCNLHLMMVSFYHPNPTKYKILIEKNAFPSDIHAVTSQILHHKLNPNECIIELGPRSNEECLRLEDIINVIETEGDSIALVLFSGVHYYTGQLFDIKTITEVAHRKECIVGFDIAHAVGNVPLSLHDWNVDFACWCSYKYLNCGPGSIGGCFVHEKHTLTKSMNPKSNVSDCNNPSNFAGWWGHRLEDRFAMSSNFISCDGAYAYRLSNPPVLLIACVRASLDIFDSANIHKLREKSILLTGYLEYLIKNTHELRDVITILTPSDPMQRGCQLSLSFNITGTSLDDIHNYLQSHNVICDTRKPNVIRVAPTPLYNSFTDVHLFIEILKDKFKN
jgi:kynureninase